MPRKPVAENRRDEAVGPQKGEFIGPPEVLDTDERADALPAQEEFWRPLESAMTTRNLILNLSAYPFERYERIDLNRLSVYVIRWLTEHSIPTSIENIAVASFRCFPGKFQMCDYPEFPDTARTNRALLQLRPRYRGWATGSAKRGFVLTPAGDEVARQTAEMIRHSRDGAPSAAQLPKRREAGKATIDRKRRLEELRQSDCFKKYQAGQEARGLDFLDMLSAYSHTPPNELRRSLRELETVGADEDDQELHAFIAWCRQAFAVYLKSANTGKGTP